MQKKNRYFTLVVALVLILCALTLAACTDNDNKSTMVASVALDKTESLLMIGDTLTLTATINPVDATNKDVTWSSDNISVATVSNGVVTALSGGTAIITV